MFLFMQNTTIFREIANAFQLCFFVCVLELFHKHIATTDIMKIYFDWAIKTSHMWLYVIKQTWHLLHSL